MNIDIHTGLGGVGPAGDTLREVWTLDLSVDHHGGTLRLARWRQETRSTTRHKWRVLTERHPGLAKWPEVVVPEEVVATARGVLQSRLAQAPFVAPGDGAPARRFKMAPIDELIEQALGPMQFDQPCVPPAWLPKP